MATPISQTICFLCEKTKVTYVCQGCLNHFCIDDLLKHRTKIEQEIDQLQNDHDQIRQQINDFKIDPTKHSLIKQIDQWEIDSINKIKQHAQLYKTQFIRYSNSFLPKIEEKLIVLAQQMKNIHQEQAFNEVDLSHLKQKLQLLHEELNQPTNVSIKQQSTPFIDKISVRLPVGRGKNQ